MSPADMWCFTTPWFLVILWLGACAGAGIGFVAAALFAAGVLCSVDQFDAREVAMVAVVCVEGPLAGLGPKNGGLGTE
jgi:hypothetical protein